MMYVRSTDASVDECVSAVERAAAERGFGILHTYDFKSILEQKGHPIESECRVLEVCSPAQAGQILRTDMDMNVALPCRISVYQKDGGTFVGMIRPTSLVGLVSEDEALRQAAEAVDEDLRSLIDQAAGVPATS